MFSNSPDRKLAINDKIRNEDPDRAIYFREQPGKEYALKKESKELFRSFWGLEDEIPAEQPGIYYAKKLAVGDKTVQLILLDVRYNRDAPETDGDVLGEAQWSWLEQELSKPADLQLIVSGFQILLDERTGSETWGQIPLGAAATVPTHPASPRGRRGLSHGRPALRRSMPPAPGAGL